MKKGLCRIAVVLLAAPLISQAAVGNKDVAAFLAAEPQLYGEVTHPSEQVLSMLLKNLPKPGFDGAARELAHEWKISPEAAALVAEAQLRAEIIDAAERLTADEAPHAHLFKYYEQALKLEPESAQLWSAVREQLANNGQCDSAAMREIYFKRPTAVREFLSEDDPACSNWVLTIASRFGLTPLTHWRLVELLDSEDDAGRLAARAARAALMAQLRAQGHAADSIEMLHLTRAQWLDLAALGLPGEIVRQGDALDPATLAAVLDESRVGDIVIEGTRVVTYEKNAQFRDSPGVMAADVRIAWLLALHLADRTTEARVWRDRWHLVRSAATVTKDEGDFRNTRSVFGSAEADTLEFIQQMLMPDDADPFDLFIGDGARGLWWSTGNDTPLSISATSRFFAGHGYADIARDMHLARCQRNAQSSAKLALPADLARSRDVFRDAIAAQRHTDGCDVTAATETTAVARSQSDYVEKSLPPALRTVRPREDAHSEEEDSQERPQQPACIEGVDVVRCDKSGSVWAAISVSGELDPTGEIGGGGYWLHLSGDQGRTWQPPVYLGLQQMQPYVVMPTSRLPLINGSKLQVAVMVRELDPESISFPPVGLRARRSADDIYIERDLGDLQKDTDGDGLTDVVEDKLRTNPAVADSDGDGLDDDIDPLPQVSIREPPIADAPVLKELLGKIAGYDAGAIRTGIADPQDQDDLGKVLKSWSRSPSARVTFMQADPALFTGLLVPDKLVLLNERDLAYLNARYGVHYPVGFRLWFNKAHTRAVATWSASWVGGRLSFTRKGNTWTAEETEGWIT